MNRLKITGTCISGTVLAMMMGSAGGAQEETVTLSRIEGNVLVSQGQQGQYIKGWEGMKLTKGNRVMVMKGHKVLLSGGGCQYSVGSNELVAIGRMSICKLSELRKLRMLNSSRVGSYSVSGGGGTAGGGSGSGFIGAGSGGGITGVGSGGIAGAGGAGGIAGIMSTWAIPAGLAAGLTTLSGGLSRGSENRSAISD